VAIQEADHEAELIDAEPCPSGVLILSSIDMRMLMYHMGPTSLAGIMLIAIGRDDDRIIL
jgi:hypothetical protein